MTLSSVFLVVMASVMGGYVFGVRKFWGKNLLFMGIVWLQDELQTMAYGRIGAMFVLSILPIFVPFILLRNFFIKGLSEGMLKG